MDPAWGFSVTGDLGSLLGIGVERCIASQQIHGRGYLGAFGRTTARAPSRKRPICSTITTTTNHGFVLLFINTVIHFK
jgi:hypothetical protein